MEGQIFRIGVQGPKWGLPEALNGEKVMIIAINYDLKKPGQNYEKLYSAIKGLGVWWHYLGSTWLVETTLTATQVWDRLAPHVDTNDRFLVIGVTQDYSGWLSQDAWDWLNSRRGKMAA